MVMAGYISIFLITTIMKHMHHEKKIKGFIVIRKRCMTDVESV